MIIIILINTLFFLSTSALHFYWALGGSWGKQAVLPVKADQTLSFRPGLAGTLVVAVGLLLFALMTPGNYGIYDEWINRRYFTYSAWGIALIFMTRAIGDFKLVGFFKRVRHTAFARNDTRYYSPLSLIVGLFSLLMAVINQQY